MRCRCECTTLPNLKSNKSASAFFPVNALHVAVSEWTSERRIDQWEKEKTGPNPATSSNAKKAIERLNTRVTDLLQ